MKISEAGIIRAENREIRVNKRELAQRMGMGFNGDVSIGKKAFASVLEAAVCRACFVKSELYINGDSCDFGCGEIKSKALCKNLEDCRNVYLVALTTGIGVDRLITRAGAKSTAEQFLTDAAASAFADGFADFVWERLNEKTRCKPRFSPGFGGFGLEFQGRILEILDAQKLIGLSVTKNNIMIPRKSITAVIGTDWE